MGVAIRHKERLASWLTDTRIETLRIQRDQAVAKGARHIGARKGFVLRLKGNRLPHIKQDSEYWRGVLEGWTEADALLEERGHRWRTSR